MEGGFALIDPDGFLGGAVEMSGALNRGEIVSIMGDRTAKDPGGNLAAEFLGARAFFPVAPYRLAASTGAPIVILFSAKAGLDACAIRVADVIRVEKPSGRGAGLYAPALSRYVAALERYAAEHPYQFFNFIDMWS